MKLGQLITLIFICIVVGIAGWVVKKKGQQSWNQEGSIIGTELYAELPINDVRQLSIKSKDGSVILSKGDEYWTVESNYGYYADFVKVADFLKKVKDLKIIQKIDVGKNDLGRLELNAPDQEADTATEIEFFSKSNASLGKILLGKEHMKKAEGSGAGPGGGWPDGRYIYQPKSKVVALVSETFSGVSDKGDQWLDKGFIKADKLKRATVKKDGGILWTVSRDKENDSLQLEGELSENEEVDTSKINGIDGALRFPSFNKVADPVITDDIHGFNEGREFIAETFTGFMYTIHMGKKDADENYPVKISVSHTEVSPAEPPEDETEDAKATREADEAKRKAEAQEKYATESERYSKWVYLLSSYVVDDMILNRSDLIKEKVDDVPAPESEMSPAIPVTVPNENEFSDK